MAERTTSHTPQHILWVVNNFQLPMVNRVRGLDHACDWLRLDHDWLGSSNHRLWNSVGLRNSVGLSNMHMTWHLERVR